MVLWTTEHAKTLIPTCIIMLIISLVFRKLLINKPLKTRMIPFQILAVLIFLIEIGKQTVSLIEGYDLYVLPFHYCSLFIFMLPLAAFYKEKHKTAVWDVCLSICAAVFLILMIYPDLIYGAQDVKDYFTNYLSFHTVTFHNVVVFEFFLILALNLCDFSFKRSLRSVIIFMAVFSIIAAVMAHLLKTNFANMYSCNIPPLESLRMAVQNSLGYTMAQIVYVCCVGVIQAAFTIMASGFSHLIIKPLNKKYNQ